MKIEVSEREFHTILAALRYYQGMGQPDTNHRFCWIDGIATNNGKMKALDADEIDQLCERMNVGD